ncbi:MAG: hypothetical protein RLO51_24545 [Thalassobaculum sp.]|uniref:hypothetical protein n=1 Tax=Thalassobaculum sp. TaxID=2022740 RepID=UPI0032EF12DE
MTAARLPGRSPWLAVENEWIAAEPSTGAPLQRMSLPPVPPLPMPRPAAPELYAPELGPEWRVHGLGHVHLVRRGRRLSVRLDGRQFDSGQGERLVTALARFDGRVDGVDVAVWSGGLAVTASWLEASFASCDAAARFVRKLAAVATGAERVTTLRISPVGSDQLPKAQRAWFDRLMAAWTVDRSLGAGPLARLFRPGGETMHEGLKVVRRFGGNLRFEAYRMAIGHRWIRDQERIMHGGDLRAVIDRRLARSLLQSVAQAHGSGQQVIEQVSGLVQVENGYRFTDYHRLTLPLGAGMALIATSW